MVFQLDKFSNSKPCLSQLEHKAAATLHEGCEGECNACLSAGALHSCDHTQMGTVLTVSTLLSYQF